MKHHNNFFHQLLKVIPKHEFQKVVDRHSGDQRVRTLSCWTQFLAMMFAQLAAQRSSIREFETSLTTLMPATIIITISEYPLLYPSEFKMKGLTFENYR